MTAVSPRLGGLTTAFTATSRRSRVTLGVASLLLLVVVAWAVVPGVFAWSDPLVGVPADKLAAPSPAHPLGTDYLGRDVFSRMVHGTRTSLLTALLAVVIGVSLGVLLGLASGLGGRRTDSVVMRFVDVLLSIPELLLAMLLVAVFGFSAVNAAIAIGLSSVATFARVTRSEALGVRSRQFVEVATLSGANRAQLVWDHILPNIRHTILSLALLRFGAAILAISTLSFLGFGSPPPAPEWGQMVAEGVDYFYSAPWLVYGPALVIVAVVLAVNSIAAQVKEARHG